MEITQKSIPHIFRNKYLKNSSAGGGTTYIGSTSPSVTHIHDNKEVLDSLTSEDIKKWNGKLDKTVWDKAFYFDEADNLKVKLNLIGEQEVAAYGSGSTGGSGGVVTIVDNLTSNATDCALSANQGRVLKSLIDNKSNVTSWNDLTGKPSTFAPSPHTHTVTEVTNLSNLLDGKASASDLASHIGNTDLHHAHSNKAVLDGITSSNVSNWNGVVTNWNKAFYFDSDNNLRVKLNLIGEQEVAAYGSGAIGGGGGVVTIVDNLTSNAIDCALSANQGRVLKSLIDSKSNVSSWNDLTGKPSTFAPSPHTHTVTEVTNLSNLLDGKAAVSHTHTIGNVTNLQSELDSKAANTALTAHTSNTTIHITAAERTNWNSAFTNNHSHSNKSVLDGITSAKVTNWDGVVTNWNKAFYFDSDNNLRVKLNLIGEQEVAAYGSGSTGGGGAITIVDALTSTATDAALSANQGRILKGLIDSKSNVSSWNDLTDKPSTFTPSTHTHNYVSTVKVGATSYSVSSNTVSLPAYPTIPTSLKNPNALTISLNGVSQGAYDGSVAKSINITAANVGAAASSHSHSYLPLNGGTLTGNVTISTDSTFGWNRNTDSFTMGFKNTNDGDTDSYGWFKIADNGNEYFKWQQVAGSTTTDLMTLKSDGLRVKGTKVSLEGHTHTIANITNIGSASVNYANSAGSVAWGNVTGKPSYFASNSLNFIASVADANQGVNNGNGYNINGITYWRGTNSTKNIPTGASNAWGIMNLGMGGNHGTSYQYAAQIYVGTQGSAPYFRKQAGGNFNAWREFAFIDSNVASATKLQTPRSINGTNFDGTANITTATWGNARTLTLSGNASGSVSINGGSNVTLSVSNNYATNAGNADTLDSYHETAFVRNRHICNKSDYQHIVILLWKDGDITNHQIVGKLFTTGGGGNRWQYADINFWHSRWAAGGIGVSSDYNFTLNTNQIGNGWRLITCTYNGATWWALQHTNTQAISVYFQGLSNNVNWSKILYKTTNTATINNAEVNGSITNRDTYVSSTKKGGFVSYATLNDNVASTTKLQTARTINGTSFNGTANITTANWGTARNIYIQDAPASYTGAAISVNGSANAYLRLPNSIVCGDWFRSTGQTGWYSNTYGGGIYMIDTTYVRVYNGKSFYCPSNILAAGEVTAYSSSDRRLKKNIKSISNSLDLIEKLNPVQFKWNKRAKELNKEKDERNNYGLIAQEVEEILPELVHPIYDKYKSVDYEQLIPILIQSIKELNDKINVLQNKINAKQTI